jgi:hypothetical protein
MLGTHFVEWELARRQRLIDRLVAEVDGINRDLDLVSEKLAVYQLVLCLIELKARSERSVVDDWQRFVHIQGREETVLDSAIENLVRPRLASIDAESDGLGGYVYRLHLDWAAIVERLREESVPEDLALWLNKQL